MNKECYRCGKTYLLEEFPVNRRNKDGRHHLCKECKNYENRHAYRSRDKIKRYNKTAHQKRKERYYRILDKNAQKVCEECGYTSNYWAPFDFHHRDPSTKECQLSSMVRHKEETIVKEIAKCIVLCSNCHRLLHYKEQINEED